ncbi:MAG: DsbA family protein [Thermodesulfobacteriota bacterium]
MGTKARLCVYCSVLAMACWASWGWTAQGVDWSSLQKIQLPAEPVDVTLSEDGKWFFVLTKGKVLVYQAGASNPFSSIDVDKELDKVVYSAAHESLVLTSRSGRSLEVIRLEFIQDIFTDGLPFKGPEKAAVTIAVFDDYQCPYCARLEAQLKQILERYPEHVKLVVKQFPLRSHPYAMAAAKAALAAHRQGRFWELHGKLFEKYKELNEAKIRELAESVGLDMAKFDQDIKDPALAEMINRDLRNGFQVQVQGTPTVFVNGKLVRRADLKGIMDMVESELRRKKVI